jgi:hypothetical protein
VFDSNIYANINKVVLVLDNLFLTNLTTLFQVKRTQSFQLRSNSVITTSVYETPCLYRQIFTAQINFIGFLLQS